MVENHNGSGKFTEVTLRPHVTITNASQVQLAKDLHHEANKICYIANSCNFEVLHKPKITVY